MEIFEGSLSNADANNGIIILRKSISKKKSITGKKRIFHDIMDTQGIILEDFIYSDIKMIGLGTNHEFVGKQAILYSE